MGLIFRGLLVLTPLQWFRFGGLLALTPPLRGLIICDLSALIPLTGAVLSGPFGIDSTPRGADLFRSLVALTPWGAALFCDIVALTPLTGAGCS